MPENHRLSPRQADTLDRLLVCPSGIPRADVDGRVLRALIGRKLAEERGDLVHATTSARRKHKVPAEKGSAVREPSGPRVAMSAAQQELLATLSRRSEPISEDEVDGRSMRALISRNLAQRTAAGLVITPSGIEAHRELGEPRPAGRKKGRPRKEHPRAAAIIRAARLLEEVVPPDSELAVGHIFAHIDDVLHAFRRFARQLREKR
jgi:hypothetical protein